MCIRDSRRTAYTRQAVEIQRYMEQLSPQFNYVASWLETARAKGGIMLTPDYLRDGLESGTVSYTHLHRFLVAVAGRMLLPNERIRSYRVKLVKILFPKRPEFHEFAFQDGLKIERHLSILSSIFGCMISIYRSIVAAAVILVTRISTHCLIISNSNVPSI